MPDVVLKTLGIIPVVTIGDLGATEFVHPTTVVLTDTEDFQDIVNSSDLASALNAGYIKLTYGSNIPDGDALANLTETPSSGEERGTITTNEFINRSFSSVLLAAKNNKRCCVWILNQSKKDMFLNFDNPATKDHIKLKKDQQIKLDHIKGDVFGVWAGGAKDGALIIETSHE